MSVHCSRRVRALRRSDAPMCTMPHARRGPLPSASAAPGAARPRRLDRVSPRGAPDGRGTRCGVLGSAGHVSPVGPGRARRASARRRAYGARPPPGAGPGLLAATALRAAPSAARRVARRSPEGDAGRRGAGPRGRRGRLRSPRADAVLVARRGCGLLPPPRRPGPRAAGPGRPLVGGALMVAPPGRAALGLAAGVALLGLAGPADPAGLPWLALVALALGLVQLPLGNGFSRRIERQADDFALATTGNAPAFIGAMERLARLNLAERRPSRLKEIVLYSHPALDRRIARARASLA